MIARWFLPLVVLFSVAVAVPVEADTDAVADAIDEIVKAEMKEKGIPGLSLAVVHRGKVVARKGYGLANVELKVPATEDTIYEIGSITKSFTATVIMDLVEEGKIDLDGPIGAYLDDIPEAWKPVTVRQLLNHTSGIKSYTSVGSFENLARNEHTQAEIIKLVADAPADFEPGSSWSYNNTGYFLLGMIVEKVCDRPFSRVLDERVLKPLGMTATRPSHPRPIIEGRSAGYGKLLGLLQNRDPLSPTAAFSAGFLISNVDDMLKWADAQGSDVILTSASREAMTTPARLNDGSTKPYGFGWGVDKVEGHRRIAHGGGTAGFSTLLSIYPDDGLTIVILGNLAGADVGDIERKIARRIVPELAPPELAEIEDPEPETTSRIRDAIARLMKKEVPADALTTKFAEFVESAEARRVFGELASEGELAPLALVERKVEGDLRRLSYNATVGKTRYRVRVDLDEDGKIAGLRARKLD